MLRCELPCLVQPSDDMWILKWFVGNDAPTADASSWLAWFFWRLTSTSARSPLHGRYTCCSSTGIVFVSARRWEVPDEEGVYLSEGSMSLELSNSAWLSWVIWREQCHDWPISAAFCKCVKVTMWDVRASLSHSTAWVSERWGDLPSRQTLSHNSIWRQIQSWVGLVGRTTHCICSKMIAKSIHSSTADWTHVDAWERLLPVPIPIPRMAYISITLTSVSLSNSAAVT